MAVAPVAEGGAHDVADQDAAQAAGLIPANLVATAVQVEAEQDAGNQVVADPMIADLAAAQVAVDQGVGNQIGVVPVVNDLVVIDSEYVEPEIEVLNPVGRQEDSDGEAGENELFRTARDLNLLARDVSFDTRDPRQAGDSPTRGSRDPSVEDGSRRPILRRGRHARTCLLYTSPSPRD